MRTLIAYPDSKEKLSVLKSLMKVLKIPFEEAKSPYNPEFVSKILKGEEDIKA